jgi:hypothetical protein
MTDDAAATHGTHGGATPPVEERACPACGTRAGAEARFCRRCGAAIDIDDPDEVAGPTDTVTLPVIGGPGPAESAPDQVQEPPAAAEPEPGLEAAAEPEPAAPEVAPESEPVAPHVVAAEPEAEPEPAVEAEPEPVPGPDGRDEEATLPGPDDGEGPGLFDRGTQPPGPEIVRPRVDTVSSTFTAASGRLVTCPSCGAANAAARELCGRCGVDLESGEPHPELVPAAERAHGTHVDPLPRRRRWWWPVLAVIATVALVVAGLWWAQLGPFASEPELPPVNFDAAAYLDDAHDVVPLSDVASLTSAPPEDGRSFDPARMLDGDVETAWRGVDADLPESVPQTIDLILETPAWLDMVVFAVGDQFDDESFAGTARPARVQVTLDGGETFIAELLDQLDPQAVRFPSPRLTTTVRLEILDVVPGAESVDPAMTRVEVRGWTATPEDAALATERAELERAAGPVVLSRG